MTVYISRKFITRVILAVFITVVLFLLFSRNSYNSSSGLDENQALNRGFKKANLNSPGQDSKERAEVDLVVVEEHHEVLHYWFEAANKGVIPKSGNILLHIDAHSDMAPPENIENYPFFRWPKNEDEIGTMMQSNDVFIQAAAMSGLFKKVIWVWPSWDEESHDKDNYIRYFGAGWTSVTVDGKAQKAFCECEFKKDGITKGQCQYINRTAIEEEDYDGNEIDPKSCKIEGKIEYLELVDYNALNKIMSGELVKEGESLLLDIDEDFFGCVLRGQNLVDASIPWMDIVKIDELLNDIFCPTTIEHEELGNDIMQMVLKLIVKKCKNTEKLSKACLTPRDPANKDFTVNFKKIINSFMAKRMFCEMEIENLEKKLSLLVENLLHLKMNQLRAIANAGFCMQTTPRSYDPFGFQICHGANEPNSSVVTEHMPGENELRLRLVRLRRIVESENYPTPGIVTLCRSVRDGYTPVSYFTYIEKNVIKSIQKSRLGVRYNVVYDKYLLGGIKGWPSRQKKYISPNLKKMKRNR